MRLIEDTYKHIRTSLLLLIAGQAGNALADANINSADERTSYYVERQSYGTQKETDPPRYVKQVNKTWLKDSNAFADADWLDIGAEYCARFEHRDNDFRRNDENTDDPILLRTRVYIGVKQILDPLRFAIELQDSRRNNSDYSRQFDTRDINQADIIQAYLELHFDDNFLGNDNLGNNRPIWLRAGRHAWEAVDRRLIARNEWRNTTNNFEGVRVNIGQKQNDWQLEAFAVKPMQRFTKQLDEVDHAQDFYGLMGDWRGWSQYVTLQPYYLLLKQNGDQVKYDTNGQTAPANTRINREIHTAGLRAYGAIGNSGFDYDASYVKQWGKQDRLNNTGSLLAELNHDAYAYNAEIGYHFNHAWKPRLSVFYGVASGDKNSSDGNNQRFERLFGFSRPWSNDDYIQMENISTPKLRLEFEPKLSFLNILKVDTGFSWYRLQSATDRWNAGANLRDTTGASGKDLGKEFDVRLRFPVNQQIGMNIGYAKFWAGDFIDKATQLSVNRNEPNRQSDSNFVYVEISANAF